MINLAQSNQSVLCLYQPCRDDVLSSMCKKEMLKLKCMEEIN